MARTPRGGSAQALDPSVEFTLALLDVSDRTDAIGFEPVTGGFNAPAVRRARTLDSWARYRAAGVNLALGTDTYPRDLIMQMRTASYFGKVTSRDLSAASAAEVFEAATLGGAADDYDVENETVFAKADGSRSLAYAAAAQRAVELGF